MILSKDTVTIKNPPITINIVIGGFWTNID